MKHPYRVAMENFVSKEELKTIFARNVVLYSHMLSKPVHGIETVIEVVYPAIQFVSHIVYTLQVSDSLQTFLFWEGNTGGKKFKACYILVDGEDGLITEMRVVMRPWQIATLFRSMMYKELSNVVPDDYWEPDPSQVIKEGSRTFTSIALEKIPLARDFELHSPILARPMKGKESAVQALKLAQSIRSRSSYRSIIATPDMVIELFDCDAAGNPMEGLWVSKLNEQGQVYDLTVYLRPYPSVAILRSNAKSWQRRHPNLPLWVLISIGNWPLQNDDNITPCKDDNITPGKQAPRNET